MLSTYLSYRLITRDMLASLDRTAGQSINAREAAYYRENIGKVATIDEFLGDYRLYSYAMKAYGLEEMTYAKAFMRKVLESDVSDADSFANRLTDERYRTFAAAFGFGAKAAPAAQTEAQLDAVIGLYKESAANAGSAITEETRYYNAVIDTVADVDQLLSNDRLRAYVFTAFGIDERTWSRENLRQVLTSDVDDPDSYVNQTYTAMIADLGAQIADAYALIESGTLTQAEEAEVRAGIGTMQASIRSAAVYVSLSAAFDFAADGTAAPGGVQSAEQRQATTELYTLSNPRANSAVAALNRDYFESRIATITTVDELIADPRLLSYVQVAFDLDKLSVVASTIGNILTSDPDPDNPTSYINLFGGADTARYRALRAAFNFGEDGTLSPGDSAQTEAQTRITADGYLQRYDDKDEEADAKAVSRFRSQIGAVKTVEDFTGEASLYDFALKAFGIDPARVSALTVKNVLKSDLADPKSYVYALKDPRFLELAKAFNFGADGAIAAPRLAQSEAESLATARAYITEKSRFGTADDRKLAEEEAKYYARQMQQVESVADFLTDPRLVAFALSANGIDPKSVDAAFMAKVFASDLDDPQSFVNGQAERAGLRRMVASYNFGPDGMVVRAAEEGIQSRRGLYQTVDSHVRQMMEEEAGSDNAGVRLALYFERKAPEIASPYDLLADDALYQVFKTLFSLPEEIGNADVDAQAAMIERYLDLEDLRDPEKVSKMIVRFAVLYDADNMTATDPALAILGGASPSGIGADLMMSLAQLRIGGR